MGSLKEVTFFQESSTVKAAMDGDVTGITLDRPRVIVDVNLLIVKEDQILLGRRCNTGFANGCYSLPAGHLELGESVVVAAIREAKEELNIEIDADDLCFAQVMHNAYGIGRLAFFFEVKKWSGDIVNMEPQKCDDLRWFNTARLPADMVPYIREGIGHYIAGRVLTLYGW